MRKEKREGRKVKINSKIACVVFFTFHFSFFTFHLYSADFGLLLNQYAETGNEGGGEAGFEYKADILPRFSLLLGDSGNLFVSAGITLGVNRGDSTGIFELLQTDFSYRSGNWGIRAGRMRYIDPLGFIAAGLFDGVHFSLNTTAGYFSAGAWYTGLLYKKNAVITVTAADQVSFDAPVDYGNLSNTYFAPRRFLMSLDWEHPSVAELLNLKAAVTIQADLTDTDEKYHSQYFTLKALIPYKSFVFEFGGSLETAESEDFNTALAWDFGVLWTLPGSLSNRLSFTGHFAGGNTGGNVGAFVPVTGKFYGNVLKVKLSGISILNLDYTVRFAESLGMNLTVSHFIRNDQGTYTAYPVNIAENSGYSLGTELFARFVWSPFSDLQLDFGVGTFLPALGNVNPEEKTQWLVELTAILSVF